MDVHVWVTRSRTVQSKQRPALKVSKTYNKVKLTTNNSFKFLNENIFPWVSTKRKCRLNIVPVCCWNNAWASYSEFYSTYSLMLLIYLYIYIIIYLLRNIPRWVYRNIGIDELLHLDLMKRSYMVTWVVVELKSVVVIKTRLQRTGI